MTFIIHLQYRLYIQTGPKQTKQTEQQQIGMAEPNPDDPTRPKVKFRFHFFWNSHGHGQPELKKCPALIGLDLAMFVGQWAGPCAKFYTLINPTKPRNLCI